MSDDAKRVPCTSCGAGILIATADRNEGQCMKCKPSTDQSMPKSTQGENPIAGIFAGLFLIGLGAGLYYLFYLLESGGIGSIRLPGIIIIAYKLSGKWIVSGLVGILGVFLVYVNILDVLRRKK
ncbi:MAG: hypothetical protein HRT89_01730 [Lentisphaeria bacterium]|nr:hypothetical protein [Lentisphaeria bacterium]NQZ66767.1 hypothetical protein [Lentisphaeria bacterium]